MATTPEGVQYPTGVDTHPSAAWWANLAASTSTSINAARQAAIASAASTAASGDATTLTSAKAHTDSAVTAARQALEAALTAGLAAKSNVGHLHGADAITTGTFPLARIPVATSGTSSATAVVRADDSRLSNRRDPNPHTHGTGDVEGLDDVLEETVAPLEQMVTTGRLSEASLSTTIATETEPIARTAGADAAVTVLADQPAVAEAAATRAGALASDPAMAANLDTDGSATRQALTRTGTKPVGRGELTINVRDHGATGDGVTNDTAAIQAAINAAAPYGVTVLLTGGSYNIASTLTVPVGAAIQGVDATLHAPKNATALRINGSDTTVQGLHIVGTYTPGDTALTAERLIDIRPTIDDGTVRLRNVAIRDTTITTAGVHGIRLRWVEGFAIENCTFNGWGQGGVILNNARAGTIHNCRFYGDGSNPFGSTYAINVATSESDWTTGGTDPGSAHIDITSNYVTGVNSSAITNHGATGVTVRGNRIIGCRAGIAGVVMTPENPVPVVGMVIADNYIDGGHLDGTGRAAGIRVVGDRTTPSAVIVTGNVVRRHNEAIYVADAPHSIVANNQSWRCWGNGIHLVRSGGTVATGNLIGDVWAVSGSATPAAFYLDSDGTTVTYYHLTGNVIRRGDLQVGGTVAVINAKGVEGPNSNTIRSTQAGNDWSAAALPHDEFNPHEYQIGWTSGSGTRVGFYGATPNSRRTVNGSRNGNAALTSLLQALANIGLINDNSSA